MADVTLLSFLKGYLEGRVRQREEEEQRAQVEQQQAVVLAQFLENIRQREEEEKYRQFQMDMSKRQMEIAEKQRAFMENHYRFMENIQSAQLELQKEESAQRREALSLQIEGNRLQMFMDLYKQTGSIDGALSLMKKSPLQAVREWAMGVDPKTLEQMKKPQGLSVIGQYAAQWKGLTMPSEKAIIGIINSYGLKGVITPNEAKALFQVQVEANKAAYNAQMSLMAAETAQKRGLIAYEHSLRQKMERMANATDEAMRKRLFFTALEDVTPFHTVLTGDLVSTPEATKDAYMKLEGAMRETLMKMGLNTKIATFYSMSGLGSILITNRGVPNNLIHLWKTYSSNIAMRRSWLEGATEATSIALGRPATLEEVHRFVVGYGNKITGTPDGGETLWTHMTEGLWQPTRKPAANRSKAQKSGAQQRSSEALRSVAQR